MRNLRLLIGVVAGLLASASPSIPAGELPSRLEAGGLMVWFADDQGQFPDLESLRRAETAPDWQAATGAGVSLGLVHSPHWFRFEIPRIAPSEASPRYLHLPEAMLSHVELYVLHNGTLMHTEQMGTDFPFHDRPIRHREFIAPVPLNATGPTEFYLRVQTRGSLQVEPLLWERTAFTEQARIEAIVAGLFYGIMLVMVLYNLFVYFVVHDRSYLYYVGYVATFTLFMLSLHGDAYQFLWPNAVAWNTTAVAFWIALLGVLALGFTSSFLKLQHDWPRVQRIFQAMLAISVLLVGLTFLLDYPISIRLNTLHGVVIMAAILAVSSIMWFRGFRHARYFVLAWAALLVGTAALALGKWGVLPWNPITAHGAQIGAVMEVVLLSFALGDRINQERAARFRAQSEALAAAEAAQSAQQELLRTQENAKQELETRVRERTRELERALQELEAVNKFLDEAAKTDQLTGLSNRHSFVHRYHDEYKRAHRHGYPLSIIIADIDHFKWFNDTHGHLAGDECLKAVSRALSGNITRAGDLLARYGGEEFIVMLSNTPSDGAVTVAERLRTAVSQIRLRFADESISVTISLGVATLTPRDLANPERLIQNADDALYTAKRLGRNQVYQHSDGDTAGAGPPP